jgi:hypothetical protein
MVRTYKYRNIKSGVRKENTETLIADFNSLVGKIYWGSARAVHDTALIDELINRDIDVSAIYDGISISFKHKIALNEQRTKVCLVE